MALYCTVQFTELRARRFIRVSILFLKWCVQHGVYRGALKRATFTSYRRVCNTALAAGKCRCVRGNHCNRAKVLHFVENTEAEHILIPVKSRTKVPLISEGV